MSEEKLQDKKWVYSEPPGGAERIYANQVNITWTGVDVTILFGELLTDLENIEQGILAVEHRSKVTIPWPVAKLLMTNLADLIGRYEQGNGEVKLPGEYVIP